MPKICILICTFDRPEPLRQLLSALVPQTRAHGCVTIIVDNGTRSSEAVVSPFQSEMPIIYERLSEPGIVSARNRAMALALESHPDFLAFIDDDEVPEPDWLANLIGRAEETGADIACGPVIPNFAAIPPRWMVKGAYHEKSGETVCTANLLLRASCIPADASAWFHREFNFSGGSDNEFLNRLVANNAIHVVAERAIVRESIPVSRLKRRYIWRRGIRDGAVIAQIAALRSKSRLNFAAMILHRTGAKLGYAFNHLFWSLFEHWRLHRAIADLASAMGIMLRVFGVKFVIYGQTSQNVNYLAPRDNEMN